MACLPEELRHVPLFSLLDDDEIAVLSQQVELRDFAAKQRIYKVGESSVRAFVMLSGAVEVTHWDGRHNNWMAGKRAAPWPIFTA